MSRYPTPRCRRPATPRRTPPRRTAKDQHGQTWPNPAGLDRGAQALVGEGGRQPDVDDRDVRRIDLDGLGEGVGVLSDGDDLEAGVAEQQAETFGEDRVVLEDHYSHGRITSTVVGPPIGLVPWAGLLHA